MVADVVTVPRVPIVRKKAPDVVALGGVVAKTVVDCAEQLPAASHADTVKLYVVEAERPVMEEPGLVTVPISEPFRKIL